MFSDLTEAHVRYWLRMKEKGKEVTAPRGPPKTVTGELLVEVIRAIKSQCQTGIAVNSTILRPLVLSIIERRDRSILQDYGGTFTCSVPWLNRLCRGLNLSMRRGTTAAQKLPDDWESKGENLAMSLAYLVVRYNIPPALVINLDQSAMQLLPMHDITRKEVGSEDVSIVGMDDKRQITAVFQVAATGAILPPQLIFQGKTDRCLPVPALRGQLEEIGWHFTHSQNHWSNQTTMRELMTNIIALYVDRAKQALGLPQSQKVVLMLDCWAVHRSSEFKEYLQKHHPALITLFIPAGCTSKLQVVDLAVNGHIKSVMKQHAGLYLSQQATEQMDSGVEAQHVKFDLRLSTLRPKLVEWLKLAVDSIEVEEIKRGWTKAGLLRAWEGAFQAKSLQHREEGNLQLTTPPDGREEEPDHTDIGSE